VFSGKSKMFYLKELYESIGFLDVEKWCSYPEISTSYKQGYPQG